MIVFGDRVRSAETGAILATIEAASSELASLPPGIARHGLLCRMLIEAGELAQGVADEMQSRTDCDDIDPRADAVMRLVRALAAALLGSWHSRFAATPLRGTADLLGALRSSDLPARIDVRTPEGFAFYAVYPEAYAEAAGRLVTAGPVRVIGLRSIGTVLAAVVAETLQAPSLQTVRPLGHPFERRVRASDRLRAAVASGSGTEHVIVDEGPGASGSSFGAVADLLEQAGVPPDRYVFLPSHEGAPGPMASARHRTRWPQSRRVTVSFDELSLTAPRSEHRLASWFEDLVGPPVCPLTDISAGAWRTMRRMQTPCVAALERRKFLLRTAAGMWLLKFAGLGRIGEEKLALARDLHGAGFVAEPLGLRHGFLLERWLERAAMPDADVDIVPVLSRYLGFRARRCPAGASDGASLPELCHMARHNTAERFGEGAAARLALDPTLAEGPRVRVDGRLHRWEWLQLPNGRLLKADALDHHAAHDAIGCQPIAWDIAGAIVEFDLSEDQAEWLCTMVDREQGRSTNPAVIATYLLCYSAFQLGLWMQGDAAGRHCERYERRLTSRPCPP